MYIYKYIYIYIYIYIERERYELMEIDKKIWTAWDRKIGNEQTEIDR